MELSDIVGAGLVFGVYALYYGVYLYHNGYSDYFSSSERIRRLEGVRNDEQKT